MLCGAEVAGVGNDRLKRGLDPKCYVAWARWKKANPGADVAGFVRERAACSPEPVPPKVASRIERRQEAEYDSLMADIAESWEASDSFRRSRILWGLRQAAGARVPIQRPVATVPTLDVDPSNVYSVKH